MEDGRNATKITKVKNFIASDNRFEMQHKTMTCRKIFVLTNIAD